ncbi:tRNA pseudouridine synthase B [Clostridium polyendosporum]|uniref:tRNA pseudouridine synthase B n=1 Tax=Clostridium polyendosporum TaxID=69208 RepID=A0A919VF61_9CLOT|nr:tRNA pseudouridine(55) synthase TruB [Clostridium polyendosporum]GIM27797.1 tRNA pseudouridine synthase B [Clostridium polyendosporum]
MNGVINVFKNTGMTSFDVVKKIRFISKEKKVGHTGTLDPEASGVLPICLGKATKIIDYIMENKKTYKVQLKLGIITDTYDLEGKILEENDISAIKEDDVVKVISLYKGEIEQIPPMYSALKVNGKRLYDLARQGIEVERSARKIFIYDINDVEVSLPYISMTVTCSKGTYIRSLCYDIGKDLNVGATMTSLCRTANGIFNEENGINIDNINEENLHQHIISIEDALKVYDKIIINKGFSKLLINGVKVADRRLTENKVFQNVLYRVYDENSVFLGLGRKFEDGFKMEKLLLD